MWPRKTYVICLPSTCLTSLPTISLTLLIRFPFFRSLIFSIWIWLMSFYSLICPVHQWVCLLGFHMTYHWKPLANHISAQTLIRETFPEHLVWSVLTLSAFNLLSQSFHSRLPLIVFTEQSQKDPNHFCFNLPSLQFKLLGSRDSFVHCCILSPFDNVWHAVDFQ